MQLTSSERALWKPLMRRVSVEEYAALKKLQNWPWAEGRPRKLDLKLSCNLMFTISTNFCFA